MRYDIDGALRKDGTLPKPSNLYDTPREVTFTIAHDQEAILVCSKQYPDAKGLLQNGQIHQSPVIPSKTATQRVAVLRGNPFFCRETDCHASVRTGSQ